jgi:hypothetical protein
LALGSWVPVLLLLIEVMVLTRIVRASRYIYDYLYPLACKLGQAELLQFERSPKIELLGMMAGPSKESDQSRQDSFSRDQIEIDSRFESGL